MSEPVQQTTQAVVRVVESGRQIDAPEWACRMGMEIARRHLVDFGVRASLAADIAEAIYNSASPLMGGKASAFQPVLHFARAEGYDRDALRAAVLMTDLPSMGDCRLVWINDGDLDAMVMRGQAKECNRG